MGIPKKSELTASEDHHLHCFISLRISVATVAGFFFLFFHKRLREKNARIEIKKKERRNSQEHLALSIFFLNFFKRPLFASPKCKPFWRCMILPPRCYEPCCQVRPFCRALLCHVTFCRHPTKSAVCNLSHSKCDNSPFKQPQIYRRQSRLGTISHHHLKTVCK